MDTAPPPAGANSGGAPHGLTHANLPFHHTQVFDARANTPSISIPANPYDHPHYTQPMQSPLAAIHHQQSFLSDQHQLASHLHHPQHFHQHPHQNVDSSHGHVQTSGSAYTAYSPPVHNLGGAQSPPPQSFVSTRRASHSSSKSHSSYQGASAASVPQALTPAPLDGGAQHEPLYVNAKQYQRIIKRRAARARLEETARRAREAAAQPNGNARKPYLHESRHKHAMRRPRGPGGRFLTAAEIAELAEKEKLNAAVTDDTGTPDAQAA